MTLLFFFKIFCDLCYYFVFAGFVSSGFGQEGLLFPHILLIALTAALCRALWDRRPFCKWHLLPLPLSGLALLLPAETAGRIALLPAIAYVCWTVIDRRMHPDYYDAADLFRLELKLLPLPALFAFVVQQAQRVELFSAPYLLPFLLGSVFYLRMVRHDEHTLRQPKFRLLNGLSLVLLCLVCAILGSAWFRQMLLAALGGAWKVVSVPVLVALVGVAALVGFALQAIIPEDFHFEPQVLEGLLEDLGDNAEQQQEGLEQATSQAAQIAETVCAILGAIAALLFIIWLFRRFIGSRKTRAYTQSGIQSRYALESQPPREKPLNRLTARTPVQQVRYWYLQLLKKTGDRGVALRPSLDTRQQTGLARDAFPAKEEELSRLRRLYLAARYDGQASKEAAREAKALFQRIEK